MYSTTSSRSAALLLLLISIESRSFSVTAVLLRLPADPPVEVTLIVPIVVVSVTFFRVAVQVPLLVFA